MQADLPTHLNSSCTLACHLPAAPCLQHSQCVQRRVSTPTHSAVRPGCTDAACLSKPRRRGRKGRNTQDCRLPTRSGASRGSRATGDTRYRNRATDSSGIHSKWMIPLEAHEPLVTLDTETEPLIPAGYASHLCLAVGSPCEGLQAPGCMHRLAWKLAAGDVGSCAMRHTLANGGRQ
jgi:hypothetical protein